MRTGSGGRRRRVRMDAPPRGARPRAWPGPASPLSSAASPGPLLPAGLRLRPPARPRPARQDTAQRPALGLLRHSGEPAPEDRRVSQGPFGLLHDIGPIKTQAPKARLVLKARADSPRKGAGLSRWKGPAPGDWGAAGVPTGRRPAWVCALQNGRRRVTGGCAGARWGEGARGLLSGPCRSRPRCPDRHHVRSGGAWRSLSRVGNTSRSGRAALGRARALSCENAGTSHDLGGRGAEPSRFTGREQAPRLNTAGRDSQRLCHL